jgi:hypothetical protein
MERTSAIGFFKPRRKQPIRRLMSSPCSGVALRPVGPRRAFWPASGPKTSEAHGLIRRGVFCGVLDGDVSKLTDCNAQAKLPARLFGSRSKARLRNKKKWASVENRSGRRRKPKPKAQCSKWRLYPRCSLGTLFAGAHRSTCTPQSRLHQAA